MNSYYAPPSQIQNGFIELRGQEAKHASKVMRAAEGDCLSVVDGRGRRYSGPIRRITKNTIQIEIEKQQRETATKPALTLGMGIIKKRDRLEFAVEKAVELGARNIGIFRSEHTIKENVRMDRLEAIAVSAIKQSLRCWLPEISFYRDWQEMVDRHPEAHCLVAHEKVDDEPYQPQDYKKNDQQMLLMVGPEGGFSADEISQFKKKGARLVSLGSYRLRAETAAVAFLSQFLS